MRRKADWALIALSAVYFAEGIITIIQPYGERTIFLAVANSLTLGLIMAIIGLRK